MSRRLLSWIAPGLSFSIVFLGALASCSDYSVRKQLPDNPYGEDDTGTDGTDTADTGEEEEDEAAVRGRVCDPSGDGWTVGATAYIELDLNGDGTVDERVEDQTDSDGYFLLSGLPLGQHRVRVEKGSFSTSIDVVLNNPGLTELAEEECLEAEDLKVAVVTGEYDQIGSILSRMGVEYDVYNGIWGTDYIEFLKDPELMSEYDIIFFNCGISDAWLADKDEIGLNIRGFVEGGGSMYASDWAYGFYEAAFPTAVDFYGDDATHGSAYVGDVGRIDADVLDANMMAILGSNKADLTYDLGAWAVPVSVLSTVQVMVSGDARLYVGGTQENAPLAVKLERGGTAIYTSFHNEQQITLDMEALLEEIVLNL
jgi:hypothetical protein